MFPDTTKGHMDILYYGTAKSLVTLDEQGILMYIVASIGNSLYREPCLYTEQGVLCIGSYDPLYIVRQHSDKKGKCCFHSKI